MDYTTPDEIRREYLTQLSTGEQPALAKHVTLASRLIDRYTSRRFYTTTGDEVVSFDIRGSNPYAVTSLPPASGLYYFGYQYFDPNRDIASVTSLELAESTIKASSGTFCTVSTGDYFLQPSDRVIDGWPAQRIELTDEPAGTYNSSAPFMWFQPGFRTVKITGKFGWGSTSIDSTGFPQEIRAIAVELAVKLYRTRESGYSNMIGVSEVGTAIVDRLLSPFSYEVLQSYMRPQTR